MVYLFESRLKGSDLTLTRLGSFGLCAGLMSYLNPFTLKISYVILLTVFIQISCFYFGEFAIGSSYNPLIGFYFILINCLLDIILKLYGEILSWSLTWEFKC